MQSDEDVETAIAVLRHSADEDTIREKMKTTFIYRQAMVNDESKAADVFLVFPRFLDTPGLVWCLNSLNHQNHQCSIWYHSSLLSMYVVLQIEQDFRLLFGEATANTFLERWPTTFRARVIKESHGLVPTTELLDLMRNAESTAEVENGMNRTVFTWYRCFCKWTIYCTFWLWCQLSI